MPTARVATKFFGHLPLLLLLLLAQQVCLAAGPNLIADKLKAGDKLEMQQGANWVPVEFVEKVSDRMVRVKSPDFPTPIGALVSMLRRAKGAATKPAPASSEAENPFATEAEQQAAQTPRTWKNSTGSFSVEATLLKVDGGKAVLRRKDDKEISVPIDKLSDADQKFLADFKPGKGRPSAGTSQSPAEEVADEPQESAPEIVPTELLGATQVTISEDAAWTYKPAAVRESEPMKPVQIALKSSGGVFERPVRSMVARQAKQAYVVSSGTRGGAEGTPFYLQTCDLARNKVGNYGKFGVDLAPLDVSPDGSLILARRETFGFGNQGELRVYSPDGDKFKAVAAWLPYGHHKSPHAAFPSAKSPADSSRPPLDQSADVTWAQFLDPSHVMTLSAGGELALWNVPKIEPVYYLPGQSPMGAQMQEPALSPTREYLAIPVPSGVAILRALDGEQAGMLAGDMAGTALCRLGWSDDGTRLALFQSGRIRVWDLKSRELTRDFSIDSGNLLQSCGWASNNHLLLNGSMLVDVERRIPVALTAESSVESRLRNGYLWTLSSAFQQSTLSGRPAMPKGFKDPVPGKSADELLMIKPGIEMSLQLPAGATPEFENARQEVMNQLERNGVKIVPESKVKLVGTLVPGATRKVRYSTIRRDQYEEHAITDQVLTLSYVVDNETIWKFENTMGPPHFIQREKDETIAQALARVTKPDPKAFGRVWIPAYIARAPAELQKDLAGATPANPAPGRPLGPRPPRRPGR